MSTLGNIEGEIVAALAAMRIGGVAIATVRGASPSADRKRLATAIVRERMPAAYVVVSGREAAERATERPGGVEVTVVLAERSERGDAEARSGAVDVVGAFALAGAAAECLRGLRVAGDRRLVLLGERGLPADEGVVLWEQTYAMRRRPLASPTLDGEVVTGAASDVVIEAGPARRAVSAFSFPGVEGTVRWDLGGRGREIRWTGQLRAGGDAEMNALEASLESLADGVERWMVDGGGAIYEGCILNAYERKGPRGWDEVSGEVVQRFEMVFQQG